MSKKGGRTARSRQHRPLDAQASSNVLAGNHHKHARDPWTSHLTDVWASVGARVRALGWVGVALASAIIGGALLRFVNLSTNPPGLNQDEAVTAYDAYSLWLTGRDHHGHPFPLWVVETYGDWSSPLLTFLAAPAVGIFGLQPVTLRLVTALLGTLMIPAVYGLTVEVSRRRDIGVIAAVLIAVSPWAVLYSRYAILPITIMVLLPLTLWCALWAIRTRNPHGLAATAVLAGCTVLGYHTMKFYVPVLAGFLVWLFFRDLWRFPRSALFYAGTIALALIGPVLYMTLRDPGIGARNSYLSITNRADFGPVLLAKQYWSYSSPDFLFRFGDRDATHTMPGYGLELWSLAPLLVLGLVVLGWESIRPTRYFTDRRLPILLLVALFLAPVPGALTQFQAANRATALVPFLAVVGAFGLIVVIDFARQWTRRVHPTARRLALGALAVALVVPAGVEVWSRYDNYFTEYPRDYAVSWGFYPGLLEATEHAITLEDDYDEIWITDANQGYIYLLFAQRADPSTVHGTLQDTDPSPFVYSIDRRGKYRFSQNYQGPPAWIDPDALPLLYESRPAGSPIGYEVRGGTLADGRRLLLVHSPNR